MGAPTYYLAKFLPKTAWFPYASPIYAIRTPTCPLWSPVCPYAPSSSLYEPPMCSLCVIYMPTICQLCPLYVPFVASMCPIHALSYKKNNSQTVQESIPVGCVLLLTDWIPLFFGGRVVLPVLLEGTLLPWGRDVGPEIPTPTMIRHTPVKTLPSCSSLGGR